MKRFWKDVRIAERGGGWGVELDGRPLRTPARKELQVPTQALADAIADEWRESGDTIDPLAMPLTGLANAAIDQVSADPEPFASGLSQYGECDLLCYRADAPQILAERQAREWDPLLAWARRRFDVDFCITAGIIHTPQPSATVDRMGHAVAVLDPFRLAALSPLITIGGSLIAGLAIVEGAVAPEDAWQAVSLDERWQREQWGADAEADTMLENRRRAFMAAARLVDLLA
jgi:chaperone required for assembly of F1-ATPase